MRYVVRSVYTGHKKDIMGELRNTARAIDVDYKRQKVRGMFSYEYKENKRRELKSLLDLSTGYRQDYDRTTHLTNHLLTLAVHAFQSNKRLFLEALSTVTRETNRHIHQRNLTGIIAHDYQENKSGFLEDLLKTA